MASEVIDVASITGTVPGAGGETTLGGATAAFAGNDAGGLFV